MTDKEPTRKQLAFVEEYLTLWNGAEAARRAGYTAPNMAAIRLMKRPEVKAVIAKRMAEKAMKGDEVLTRLAQQGQLNAADFVVFDQVVVVDAKGSRVIDPATNLPVMRTVYAGINWDMVKQYGYLVKKISFDRNGLPTIEFVDSQHALELIGKHQKLFTDQVDLNVQAAVKAFVTVSPDDWDDKPEP